ncbi:MAG: hypothetical protein HZA03_05640 [Nitrospinae bacterium]|nr:hypothetical protein [Nitrospinota bacterium]
MGHMHLVLNHAPVMGLFFSIALGGYAFYVNDNHMKRAALWAYVVVGVATIFAYLTGEPAEEMVEHKPGVLKAMIETHETAALVAGILIGVIAILAAIELWNQKKGKPLNPKLMMGIVILSVITTIPIARASYLGGLIGHSEIHPSGYATQQEIPGIEAGEESGEMEGENAGMPEPANH